MLNDQVLPTPPKDWQKPDLDFPLEVLFERTNKITKKEEVLCPKCFSFTPKEQPRCWRCQRETKDFSTSSFWQQLQELRGNQQQIGLNTQSTEDWEKRFRQEFSYWLPIMGAVQFLNQFNLTKIDFYDCCRIFLSLFPLTPPAMGSLIHLNLKLPSLNEEKSIAKDFSALEQVREIQVPLIQRMASQAQEYLPSLMSLQNKNVDRFNLHYGLLFSGRQRILVNENNPQELLSTLQYLPVITDLSDIEGLLSPLHWRFLVTPMAQRENPDQKPAVSLYRYEFLLKRLLPQTPAQSIWQQLGLSFCEMPQKRQSNPSIEAALSEQLQKPRDERDWNFCLSYAVIFSSQNAELWPENMLSMPRYLPLIHLYPNQNKVFEFLENSSDEESVALALTYFDFQRAPDLAFQQAPRYLNLLSKEQLRMVIANSGGKLLSALFVAALKAKNLDVAEQISSTSHWKLETTFFDLGLTWKDLNELVSSNSKWSAVLGKSRDRLPLWLAREKVDFFSHPELPASLLKEILFSIRQNPDNFLRPWDLIQLGWKCFERGATDSAKLMMDEMIYSTSLAKKLDPKAGDILNKDEAAAFSNWILEQIGLQETTKYFENFVTSFGIDSQWMKALTLPATSLTSLIQKLKIKSPMRVGQFYNSLIEQMIAENRLAKTDLQSLWDSLAKIESPEIRHQLREQLSRHPDLKETLQAEANASEQATDQKKALSKSEAKLNEALKKIQALEQEKENLARTQDYQKQMSEIQTWFSKESSAIAMSNEQPQDKAAKLNALGETFKQKQIEAQKILQKK